MRFGLPFWIGIVSMTMIAGRGAAALSGPLDEKNILERIKPAGEVTVEAGGAPMVQKPLVTGDIGKQTYDAVCHVCHGSGVAGAPKIGDKSEWAPRISEGLETLVKHAIEGYKAMPAKGTCSTCSDEDIKKTVQYMVSQSK